MASPSLNEVNAEIDRWFATSIQRSPISHDVGIYNQAYAAHLDLKARIAALFGDEPKPLPAAKKAKPAA